MIICIVRFYYVNFYILMLEIETNKHVYLLYHENIRHGAIMQYV